MQPCILTNQLAILNYMYYQKEKLLDGLFNLCLYFNIAFNTINQPTFYTLFFLGSSSHNRVCEWLRCIALHISCNTMI